MRLKKKRKKKGEDRLNVAEQICAAFFEKQSGAERHLAFCVTALSETSIVAALPWRYRPANVGLFSTSLCFHSDPKQNKYSGD